MVLPIKKKENEINLKTMTKYAHNLFFLYHSRMSIQWWTFSKRNLRRRNELVAFVFPFRNKENIFLHTMYIKYYFIICKHKHVIVIFSQKRSFIRGNELVALVFIFKKKK